MNERINELAELAGFIDRGNNHTAYINFDHEKFADLIVKDCLAQVDKVDSMLDDDKEKTGVAWVGLTIAKHFGIE